MKRVFNISNINTIFYNLYLNILYIKFFSIFFFYLHMNRKQNFYKYILFRGKLLKKKNIYTWLANSFFEYNS